jgi:hypothetical protein
MNEQRDGETGDQDREVTASPRRGDVISEHRYHADHKVADPDIRGINQPFRRVVKLDRQVQQALADIRRADVSSQSDCKPTFFAEPLLCRRKEQSKQHQIRRPVAAIDPEQAGK